MKLHSVSHVVALVVLVLLFVVACNQSESVSVLPANSDDRVEWSSENDPVLHIRSPKGIGSVTLTLENGSWPESFRVVLHLKGLEGFSLKAGEETHSLSVLPDGSILREPEHSSVLHMNQLQALKNPHFYEVIVKPHKFAEPVSGVYLEWVDFYR